jgi:hypothetical protein
MNQELFIVILLCQFQFIIHGLQEFGRALHDRICETGVLYAGW